MSAPVDVRSMPEPRIWITAHSDTRRAIVDFLRDEAHEREQADEASGGFADLAGATLLAAIADALESDILWATAARLDLAAMPGIIEAAKLGLRRIQDFNSAYGAEELDADASFISTALANIGDAA